MKSAQGSGDTSSADEAPQGVARLEDTKPPLFQNQGAPDGWLRLFAAGAIGQPPADRFKHAIWEKLMMKHRCPPANDEDARLPEKP